jgi:hypothetical protein
MDKTLAERRTSAPRHHANRSAAPRHEGRRFAVGYTPGPHSAWWHFGCWWLGCDASGGFLAKRPLVAGLERGYVQRITEDCRRSGFQTTLKAPFDVARHVSAADVYLRTALLARELEPIALPRLALAAVNGCAALVPAAPAPDISLLAQRCAAAFVGLSVRSQWSFRQAFDGIHFPLTCALPAPETERVIEALSPLVDRLNVEALDLDALSLFVQATPASPFLLARRYGFDESVEIYCD